MITIIGRGHSGTRAISHTLYASGVFMGNHLNRSGDLLPPGDLYEACRVMAKYVEYKGDYQWDFSKLHTMPIDPAFTRLIESYLADILKDKSKNKGWKLPETTLIYPWIIRMFPDIDYIFWVRDPRDSILSGHKTDDLSDFDIPYDKVSDEREMRSISWKYQQEIIKNSPVPEKHIKVRFEDFILNNEHEILRLEEFLKIPLARIIVRKDAVGRHMKDTKKHYFDFFKEDMKNNNYI